MAVDVGRFHRNGRRTGARMTPNSLAELLGYPGGRVYQVRAFNLDMEIGFAIEFPEEPETVDHTKIIVNDPNAKRS